MLVEFNIFTSAKIFPKVRSIYSRINISHVILTSIKKYVSGTSELMEPLCLCSYLSVDKIVGL